MPSLPRSERHPRARRLIAPLAAVLLLAGCLSDPAAPASAARLAVNIPARIAFQTSGPNEIYLLVEISYFDNSESVNLLKRARFELGSGAQSHEIDVDILPCLQAQPAFPGGSQVISSRAAPAPSPDGRSLGADPRRPDFQRRAGPSCLVRVVAKLVTGVVPGETPIDQTSAVVELRIGETAEVELGQLFSGSTAPTVTLPALGVFVDAGLVRIPVNARDVDSNLSGLNVVVQDSIGTYVRFFGPDIGEAPLDSVTGAVYGFIDRPQQFVNLQAIVQAYDTKSASSAPDTVRVLAFSPFDSPTASGVTGTRAGADATITFAVADTTNDLSQVEVLFRDPAAGLGNSDLLMPVCVRAISSAAGTKSVTCPAPALANAEVIVVPIDAAGNVGRAARGTLP